MSNIEKPSKTVRTTTFTSDQLNFNYDMTKEEALHLVTNPEFGSIYYVDSDKGFGFDPMVIIDSDSTSLYVIFPRMKYINGMIEMGIDKTQENYIPPFEHTDCNPKYNGDWWCKCGGLEKLKNIYQNTFKKVDASYQYRVKRTTLYANMLQMRHSNNSYINELDEQLHIKDGGDSKNFVNSNNDKYHDPKYYDCDPIEEESTKYIPTATQNFYSHVNASWLEDPKNQIPGEYSAWGGFTKLSDDGLKKQIYLVQNLRDKTDKTEEEMKIVAIWEASMELFNNWRNVVTPCDNSTQFLPISKELEILDEYLKPNKSYENEEDLAICIAEYLHYSQINGITNVFDFDSGSDFKNPNNVVLDITMSGISLPGREYYTDVNFAEKREMFKQHLVKVAEIINAHCSTILDNNFVNNVLAFEHELATYKMKSEQTREYDKYYTNTTLTNLHKNINELASLETKQYNYSEDKRNFVLTDQQINLTGVFFEKLYELFDFRKNLLSNRQKFFLDTNIENAPHEEHITTYDGDAIRHVITMILNKDNFINYRSFLQYKIISSLKGFCTKELDDEYFDFYARKLNGQMNQKSEDKRSIQIVNNYADEMMGKVFVAHYFPEIYKKDIRNSIQEILDVMKISLNRNDWLTDVTKSKALQKLAKFNVKVGFPDVWKDYSDFDIKIGDSLYDISKKAHKWRLRTKFFNKLNSLLDRNEWLISPQTVNAYFMPTQNEIVFPAAILQSPFYCKTNAEIDVDLSEEYALCTHIDQQTYDDFIQAVNFGGIGAVIAHEITHGYDDNGRKFDGDGNLNDWWTEEDVKLFTEKTNLLAEQAESYVFVDYNDSEKKYKLKAQLTMGENLADLGGLSLALQAMTNRLVNRNSTQQYIMVNQRVLLKSFANIWKQNIKKDALINRLTTDSHAPADFRANLVKNMDEFYEAFQVNIHNNDNDNHTNNDVMIESVMHDEIYHTKRSNNDMYIPPAKRVRMW